MEVLFVGDRVIRKVELCLVSANNQISGYVSEQAYKGSNFRSDPFMEMNSNHVKKELVNGGRLLSVRKYSLLGFT